MGERAKLSISYPWTPNANGILVCAVTASQTGAAYTCFLYLYNDVNRTVSLGGVSMTATGGRNSFTVLVVKDQPVYGLSSDVAGVTYWFYPFI